MRKSAPIFILLSLTFISCYEYDDQDKWGDLCENGLQQSPINIIKDNIQPCQNHFKFSIQIKNHTYFQPAYDSNSINLLTKFNQSLISVQRDGERKEYQSTQFHLHHRAEHQINGQHHDLQLHILHKTLNQQSAVFGILFKVEDGDFPDVFDGWIFDSKQGLVQNFPIDGHTPKHVFHYKGSLTIPECTEGYDWFINGQIQRIKKSSLNYLSELINKGRQNNRNIQNLNGRKIHEAGIICLYRQWRSSLSGYRHQI